MIRRVTLRPAAARDVHFARRWYEEQRRGLGREFATALGDAMDAVKRDAEIFQVIDAKRGIRRALLRRFPYAVYFVATPERVVVLAVLHGARSPDVWQSRP